MVALLLSLLDAMAIENARAKKVRCGYSLFPAIREACGKDTGDAEAGFDLNGIRFVWASDLGAWGVQIDHT